MTTSQRGQTCCCCIPSNHGRIERQPCRQLRDLPFGEGEQSSLRQREEEARACKNQDRHHGGCHAVNMPDNPHGKKEKPVRRISRIDTNGRTHHSVRAFGTIPRLAADCPPYLVRKGAVGVCKILWAITFNWGKLRLTANPKLTGGLAESVRCEDCHHAFRFGVRSGDVVLRSPRSIPVECQHTRRDEWTGLVD